MHAHDLEAGFNFVFQMQRGVQLHQDSIADLEKHPDQEEAGALLGFVCTAAKYAADHRDVIAKWVSAYKKAMLSIESHGLTRSTNVTQHSFRCTRDVDKRVVLLMIATG